MPAHDREPVRGIALENELRMTEVMVRGSANKYKASADR
jgi:hypothetical protein